MFSEISSNQGVFNSIFVVEGFQKFLFQSNKSVHASPTTVLRKFYLLKAGLLFPWVQDVQIFLKFIFPKVSTIFSKINKISPISNYVLVFLKFSKFFLNFEIKFFYFLNFIKNFPIFQKVVSIHQPLILEWNPEALNIRISSQQFYILFFFFFFVRPSTFRDSCFCHDTEISQENFFLLTRETLETPAFPYKNVKKSLAQEVRLKNDISEFCNKGSVSFCVTVTGTLRYLDKLN